MSHFPVQAILMWDFHALYLLERWQSEVGSHVRGWLDAMAQFESIAATAGLHYDHPDWTFPTIDADSDPKFSARGIAHPLLATEQAVRNDAQVGPPGTFLLVTGSNMSGKSTLLRSIGTNIVLAQAGRSSLCFGNDVASCDARLELSHPRFAG